MCGRMVRTSPAAALAAELDVEPPATIDLRPRWNLRPGEDVLAIVRVGDALRMGTMRWGLMPASPRPAVNARIETAATRPAFREAFRRRRCLVVADGFYEWQRQTDGTRRPWFVRLRSRRPMTFAGLWARWHPPDGPSIVTCAVLTCAPNVALAAIHDRMPVVVPPAARDAWLAHQAVALGPLPGELIETWPVSSLVNSPVADGPECLVSRLRSSQHDLGRPHAAWRRCASSE